MLSCGLALGWILPRPEALAQPRQAPAENPASPATVWSAATLDTLVKELEDQAKTTERHVVPRQLFQAGDRSLLALHRDADGEAEAHAAVTDFWIVLSGEGTLLVGGEMDAAGETAPGELRGPAIRGGTSIRLHPGDLADIPAGVPHQTLVEEGKSITYLILKINR